MAVNKIQDLRQAVNNVLALVPDLPVSVQQELHEVQRAWSTADRNDPRVLQRLGHACVAAFKAMPPPSNIPDNWREPLAVEDLNFAVARVIKAWQGRIDRQVRSIYVPWLRTEVLTVDVAPTGRSLAPAPDALKAWNHRLSTTVGTTPPAAGEDHDPWVQTVWSRLEADLNTEVTQATRRLSRRLQIKIPSLSLPPPEAFTPDPAKIEMAEARLPARAFVADLLKGTRGLLMLMLPATAGFALIGRNLPWAQGLVQSIGPGSILAVGIASLVWVGFNVRGERDARREQVQELLRQRSSEYLASVRDELKARMEVHREVLQRTLRWWAAELSAEVATSPKNLEAQVLNVQENLQNALAAVGRAR